MIREPAAWAAVALLALVGAGIAGYLAHAHYRGIAPVCTTDGCEEVQTSEYAELLGVPVAVVGLAAYLALGATTLTRAVEAAAAAVAMALGGLGFALWLVYVQFGVPEAVRVWCLASDVVMALLAVTAVVRLRALASAPPIVGD